EAHRTGAEAPDDLLGRLHLRQRDRPARRRADLQQPPQRRAPRRVLVDRASVLAVARVGGALAHGLVRAPVARERRPDLPAAAPPTRWLRGADGRGVPEGVPAGAPPRAHAAARQQFGGGEWRGGGVTLRGLLRELGRAAPADPRGGPREVPVDQLPA